VLTKERWETTGRSGESTGRSQNISLINCNLIVLGFFGIYLSYLMFCHFIYVWLVWNNADVKINFIIQFYLFIIYWTIVDYHICAKLTIPLDSRHQTPNKWNETIPTLFFRVWIRSTVFIFVTVSITNFIIQFYLFIIYWTIVDYHICAFIIYARQNKESEKGLPIHIIYMLIFPVIRAPTTLKSEGEVTSLSGADKREVRDNREKWLLDNSWLSYICAFIICKTKQRIWKGSI
jgi:hypothetical protein